MTKTITLSLSVTFDTERTDMMEDAINDAIYLAVQPNFNSILNGTTLCSVKAECDNEYGHFEEELES